MAETVANFRTHVYDLELSLDTSAYAAGDVLADFQKLELDESSKWIRGTINDIKVVDKDDQGLEMDIVISQKLDTTPPVLGTENAAVSISDADAQTIVGIVNVSSYTDLVGSQYGQPDSFTPIGFNLSDANYLYVGAISRGAPTHTANGVVLKISITRE